MIRDVIIIISGLLFVVSLVAYIIIRATMKPRVEDLDDYYYEFEDQHPKVVRYESYKRVVITLAAIATLLLFVSMYL